MVSSPGKGSEAAGHRLPLPWLSMSRTTPEAAAKWLATQAFLIPLQGFEGASCSVVRRRTCNLHGNRGCYV
jgi:hypothetical protein